MADVVPLAQQTTSKLCRLKLMSILINLKAKLITADRITKTRIYRMVMQQNCTTTAVDVLREQMVTLTTANLR